jgi:hypothetical protein
MVVNFRCKKGCFYESKSWKTFRPASFENKEVFFCHGREGLEAPAAVWGDCQAG